MPDHSRALSVDGNTIGQFVTGDHNVMVSATHSTVTVIGQGQQPRPQRRNRIERLPYRGSGHLLGRDGELGAVASGEPVQVYGPYGIGKSAPRSNTAPTP
ncbi:hypothetical protein ODJ79_02330 [Actinoplanes sp. KI2]|uniref:hypothetical protein n=1 Tax=Actinoplanes sp. KI2 TaxID=2983315 RepID=UPI0021D59C39|nr:hypothetical protein [Actinoplanes sp. KI2]MCU7722543.1 hypothetical protein [Actinoplanes sp. KI2]